MNPKPDDPRDIVLNSEQLEAVETPDSALVIAGPGTGKTRVIVERIKRLIKQEVDPSTILAVTFTKRAATEMQARLKDLDNALQIRTFHSLGYKIISQNQELSGLPNGFETLDQHKQIALITRVLKEKMNLSNCSVFNLIEYSTRISTIKEKGLRPNMLTDEKISELKLTNFYIELFKNYELCRKEENVADFAELLLRSFEILRDNDQIRLQWANQFKHILVDELQDMNKIQLDLLDKLWTKNTVFFGVGDDDQSIYEFRGAQPGTLKSFQNKFADGKVAIQLKQNYRSTDEILKYADAVISNNDRPFPKDLSGCNGSGQKPILAQHNKIGLEAASIVKQIKKIHEKGIVYKSIAILYRKHKLSEALLQPLRNSNIPFLVLSDYHFFSREEIKVAIAYLKVAINENNKDEILRSVKIPPRKFGKSTLVKIQAQKGIKTLLDAIGSDRTVKENSAVVEYVTLVKKIGIALNNGGLVEAFSIAIEESGIREYYRKSNKPEKELNLTELFCRVVRFAKQEPAAELEDLLEQNAIESDDIQEVDRVSLMTIHGAKGLEFKYVLIIGLEEGVLPDTRSSKEEERRLFYVAITRAMEGLYISYQDFINTESHIPSCFVNEVSTDFYQEIKCLL